MTTPQQTTNKPNAEKGKYTVREVLDSLYHSSLDHDDDFDGNLHITSKISGEGLKIPFKEIEDNKERFFLPIFICGVIIGFTIQYFS